MNTTTGANRTDGPDRAHRRANTCTALAVRRELRPDINGRWLLHRHLTAAEMKAGARELAGFWLHRGDTWLAKQMVKVARTAMSGGAR